MSIYPKCEHLKLSMICCSLLGIFPWQFMFPDNNLLQRAYAMFSRLMLSYFIFFVVTAYIELYYIITSEVLRMDAVSANLCVTLVYTTTIVRQLIMKLSPGFRHIIWQIIDGEMRLASKEDKETIEIYNDCATDIKQKTRWYLYILFVITMQYIIRPVLVEPFKQEIGNQTIVIKPLPLSSWFPFDEQEHHLPAYLWHILDTLVGASFVTYTDILMFNLIVYPTGQLKMLQHRLRNFESYKNVCKASNKELDNEQAAYVTFLNIISRHKVLIRYMDDFNDTMSVMMIFDFLQSSLQIASILTQVIGNQISLIMLIFVGSYFIGMTLRLVLYYYYANEVIILSQGLATSVWESNWYEQSSKLKYMMFIFIMRAQKPLKFSIGPFSVMSLQSLLAILRTTYSYIMLMYGVN